MRNAKKFQLRKNLAATVYELTVAQAMEIFWLIGDFAYPSEFETFLQAHRADALTKARDLVKLMPDIAFSKLTESERQTLIGHFVDVNTAFINGGEPEDANGFAADIPDLTGFEHYQNLSALVNVMVRLGHVGVLDYPMSLLNEIVVELGKDQGQ